jgi:DHA2 family multidrug resistance protein
VHQSYLVDHLSGGGNYQQLLQQIAHGMAQHGTAMAKALEAAPNNVYQTLQTQTAVLAYIDVFMYTGFLALVLIPTALLMSNKQGGKKGPAA